MGPAREKVQKCIKEAKVEEPTDIFFKGDEFKGFVFAKLISTSTVEHCIKLDSKAKTPIGDKVIYCKKDLPLEERVALSFLLGLRRELRNWGYSVRVEDDIMEMKFQGKPILCAQVRQGRLELDWLDAAWASWFEHQNATEVTALKKAQETMTKTYGKGSKGDGKGDAGKGKVAANGSGGNGDAGTTR